MHSLGASKDFGHAGRKHLAFVTPFHWKEPADPATVWTGEPQFSVGLSFSCSRRSGSLEKNGLSVQEMPTKGKAMPL